MLPGIIDIILKNRKPGNPNGEGLPEWRPHTAKEPMILQLEDKQIGGRNRNEIFLLKAQIKLEQKRFMI